MVYTAALVFGHGMPVLSEEESVVDMIRKFLFQLTSSEKTSEKTSGGRRGSVDSCDEMEKSFQSDDLYAWELDEERLLQREMTRQLEHCLSEAKRSALCCQALLLPRQMTARVARDVVRSSADEPCGIRGASIKVYLEAKEALKPLGSISPDASVTPTFELSVVLKAVDEGWPPLKHILGTDKVLKLRPEYRLVKRKLYSSASPVIHDFY